MGNILFPGYSYGSLVCIALLRYLCCWPAANVYIYYQCLFSCTLLCKNFQDSLSHRIFRCMYKALNINKTNYTV